jgi:signal transduction histidine kinase
MIGSMTTAVERVSKLDIAIAVLFSAFGVVGMIANVQDDEINASAAAVPLFLAVTLPLAWRRVTPLRTIAIALGALLLHVVLFGSLVRCGTAFPVVFVLAYAIGARASGRDALVGLGLALAFVLVVYLSDDADLTLGVLPFVSVMTAAVWGTGRVVRSRGLMVGQLEERTHELREIRDERARLDVAADRERLSSELDELLQHRLGELATLADAGAQHTDPEGATAALAAIERESRRTLEEMRALVGVLRHDDAEAPTAPQPTLTHLDALLVHAKGTDAHLRVEGNPRALPAGVELSAYRVVEHLLDALQDSTGVSVCVRFAADAIELEVSGPAARHGERAIERARERVQLHRGTLQTTVQAGRAEVVASLPFAAAV